MDYMEILDEIIGNQYLDDYLHEGDTVSPLFIGMDNGVPIHLLLVLAPLDDQVEPVYVIGLRSVSEKPVFATAVRAERFSREELESLPMEQYAAFYPQVFEWVVCENRTGDEQNIVDKYCELLSQDAFQKWYTFLKQQFPDVFWG